MGLYDNTTHKSYYQANNLGSYQFISLNDIITQFQIAYVGENKLIPKIKRTDIAFYAQRALQELSFDTFKSIKSQQIDLPPSLTMPLPHDYVGYTKLSWADDSGIKHPLYPTKHTNNPFQIRQDDSGEYVFPSLDEMVVNNDFSNVNGYFADDWVFNSEGNSFGSIYKQTMGILSGKLMWSYNSHTGNNERRSASVAYQAIDVSNIHNVDLSADGVVRPITFTQNGVAGTGSAIIRLGVSTSIPDTSNFTVGDPTYAGTLGLTNMFDLVNEDGNPSYIEWSGTETSTKNLDGIDVSNFDTVYVIIVSFLDSLTSPLSHKFVLCPPAAQIALFAGHVITQDNINSIDNISITNDRASNYLQAKVGNEKNSSTWNNYKSTTPSENNNDDYEDDIYWPIESRRYGLEPSHAQVNGSFFIDQRLGKIHFSSNISGKTVILDYISDSLGTETEMQVHNFAEDAMYKWIAHAILSTSSYGQPLVSRLTKEKFAAVRKAKLRLSDVKLEEITQILRGKSKQIKH